MRVAIASDHGGFIQKQPLIEYMQSKGFDVVDLGPDSDERCDYPDYAFKVADMVSSGQADRGVLICGTGLGMGMSADKVAGIRAAAIQTPEFAELFRAHNNGNVICLSGRFVTLGTNQEILDKFFDTDFEGGRHVARVEKMMSADTK